MVCEAWGLLLMTAAVIVLILGCSEGRSGDMSHFMSRGGGAALQVCRSPLQSPSPSLTHPRYSASTSLWAGLERADTREVQAPGSLCSRL